MDSAIAKRIVQDVDLPESSVTAVLFFLEAGFTAPFVARYRKEATGGLDEAKIRLIQERMTYYRELEERRESLLKSLAERGAAEGLRQRIAGSLDRTEIEDLHHSLKPKRRTRAVEAAEKGLEPLAEYIWGQDPDAWSLEEHIDVFLAPEKGILDREAALQGAAAIIADWISDDFELRSALREMLWKEGSLVSTVVPAKAELKTKYNMYYNRREAVAAIPSHRVLAIRRGTKEGVLTSSIQCDAARAIQTITNHIIKDRESAFAPILELAARDSYSRILRPLIETEVRARMKERADREAIRIFQDNLKSLLMSPPCGAVPVMGLEVGKGDECRVAVVDGRGKFVQEAVICPRPPKSDLEGTKTVIVDLIGKFGVQAIAVGTGPAAREAEMILRGILAEAQAGNITIATVNDAGVAVYSSSRIGREELPELAASTRAAISMARRLQDPLAELVKIDPKLIGVGQYQHDVDQKELHRCLVQTVQSCVNRVGADLNAAGYSLLRYISGLNDRNARRIVAYREATGPFPSRAALSAIPGLSESAYQQAAGFVRLPEGETILDRSWIHPESYELVGKMAASLNLTVPELIGNREKISELKLEEFVTDGAGMPTLVFIRDELLDPGRDPRGAYVPPRIRADVRDIADLKVGLTLEGTVTNVTNFGAFVDIGVQQDGLVHLSQMSNRFIRDPREAVKVGDLVQVKVISVEVESRRIGLSMKALLPAQTRQKRKPRRIAAQSPAPGTAGSQSENEIPAREAASGSDAAFRPASPRGRRRPPNRRNAPWRPPRPTAVEGSGSEPAVIQAAVPAPQPPEPEPEPKGPEPSLQEKIAILQSKFKGIQ